uniref:Uncharacterized protein n=1 Tax=Tetraodon nigroviridis TaxID=99883 RepID=H3CAR6_TETNG
MLYLQAESGLTRALQDVRADGSPFCILVEQTNIALSSCTVIIFSESLKIHRNMPKEQAMDFVAAEHGRGLTKERPARDPADIAAQASQLLDDFLDREKIERHSVPPETLAPGGAHTPRSEELCRSPKVLLPPGRRERRAAAGSAGRQRGLLRPSAPHCNWCCSSGAAGPGPSAPAAPTPPGFLLFRSALLSRAAGSGADRPKRLPRMSRTHLFSFLFIPGRKGRLGSSLSRPRQSA